MRRFQVTDWMILLAGGVSLAGCVPASNGETHISTTDPALSSMNGLSSINGLSSANGLSGNGLSGNGLSGNGLSGNGLSGNGLSGNGLSLYGLGSNGLTSDSYLMNSADGRTTISYLVRCALPANQTITKSDQSGASYSFTGQIGVAPEWEWGNCSTDCQQQVSACMLAHVNTSGQHIALWLVGDSPAIGWTLSPSYPDEEGSFFGNIFESPPTAYYCNGKDFDVGVVPGRLGAGEGNAPYQDPFTADSGYCRQNCAAADYPNGDSGYKACFGYNHVVTVWRNPNATTLPATGSGGQSGAAGAAGTGGAAGAAGTGGTAGAGGWGGRTRHR
jgi:hypothetical protein